MRFTLADLKKTISRRKGEPHLVPFLLRPGELGEQLEALIALFEAHIGRERVYFPIDRPAELISDYRLARCLVICLSEWYEWRMPEWPEGATVAETAALAAREINSPGALRLALYDHVNATAGGYLAGAERDAALGAFAASLGLARSTLDDLLRLDAEPQTVLERTSEEPPTAAELAARYNQRVVETVLANASVVEWTIAPERDGDAENLGTLVKRACFLARRMGVQYDVSFRDQPATEVAPGGVTPQSPPARAGMRSEERDSPRGITGEPDAATSHTVGARFVSPSNHARSSVGARFVSPAGRDNEPALPRVAERRALYAVPPDPPASAELPEPATLDAATQPLVLTLYGPQELTGAPTQYGERLARLCRALLGYRRDATRGRAALAGGGLLGVARVYLHGRPLTFTLDDRLLRLLTPAAEASQPAGHSSASPLPAGRGAGGEDPFDSSLERRLAEEWASLERERATAGWRLEREPEPILARETILIPDFALRRDGRRIFLEIAGYWRPEYRERKLRKLAALEGAVPLILAAPEAARADFAPLAGRLPLLWYRDYLSAPALLALVERDYNDFAARMARLDLPRVNAEAAKRGRIPPVEAYALLRCYTRAELASAVALLGSDSQAPRWVEGVGLCSRAWQDDLLADLRAIIARTPNSRMPLAALAVELVVERPELADLSEGTIEALARQAGMRVARASLFAAEVFLSETTGEERAASAAPDEATIPAGARSGALGGAQSDGQSGGQKAQPRRAAKRKQTESGYRTTSMFGAALPQSAEGHPLGEGGARGRRRE